MDESSAIDARLVNIRCPNHHETLVRGLWNFFTTKYDVDFEIQCGPKLIRAHHLVVQIFLSLEKLGSSAPTRLNHDCELDNNLNSLLEFLYNGNVTIREEQSDSLLDLAKELDFKILIDAIQSYKSDKTYGLQDDNHLKFKKRRIPTSTCIATHLQRKIGTVSSKNNRTNGLRNKNQRQKHLPIRETDKFKGRKIKAESSKNNNTEFSRVDRSEVTIPNIQIANFNQPQNEKTGALFLGNFSGSNQFRVGDCDVPLRKRLRPRNAKVKCKKKIDNKLGNSDTECNPIGFTESAREKSSFIRDPAYNKDETSDVSGECGSNFAVVNSDKSFDKRASSCDKTQNESKKSTQACANSNELRKFKKSENTDDVEVSNLYHRASKLGQASTTLECSHCDYKTKSKTQFQVHQSKHDTSITVFRCDACRRPFFSEDKLRVHRAKHDAYKCAHCDYVTSKRWNYYEHLFVAHQVNAKGEPVALLNCPLCPFKARANHELKYHTATKHLPEKPYKCQLCNFTAGRNSDIGVHVKVVHEKRKRFMCESCGYCAVTPFSLERHRIIHTGLKPFECQACHAQFKDRYALKRHARLHGDNNKNFVCDICGHAFNRRSNMKVHLKNVHKTLLDGPKGVTNSDGVPEPTVE